MKNFLFLLFFAPLSLFANPRTQATGLDGAIRVCNKSSELQGNPSIDAIAKALNTGDTEAIAKYFADNVEISIADKEQLYSKPKATEVLRSFFASNKPTVFSQKHQGTSRESSDQYCIGNLTATTGTFRVYIYLKVNGNSVSIQEIRFDKA